MCPALGKHPKFSPVLQTLYFPEIKMLLFISLPLIPCHTLALSLSSIKYHGLFLLLL